jgi:hypothetical protein
MANEKPRVQVYAEVTTTTHRDVPDRDAHDTDSVRYASTKLDTPIETTTYHWRSRNPDGTGWSNVADTPAQLGKGLAGQAASHHSPFQGLKVKDVDLSTTDVEARHNSIVRELSTDELTTFSAAFAAAARSQPEPTGRGGITSGASKPVAPADRVNPRLR